MGKEFQQLQWDELVQEDCRRLVRLAIREDLQRAGDVTTLSLVDASARGRAILVTRQAGVMCGLYAARLVLDEMSLPVEWTSHVVDGESVAAATPLATLAGAARHLLTAERLLLNVIGRLSGIATLTRQYVDQVAGTSARIYDTRKTTPGWRRLEKYAVRCGGGSNHRTGLFDAVLIKDNHLALVAGRGSDALPPDAAVTRARQRILEMFPETGSQMIVEVEVDTLEQLEHVLVQRPDIVLLDNMSSEQLQAAVSMRNAAQVPTQLEASGGVNLESVAAIARTGVDRISVGALTHSAISLDVAMDWE
ncbi:MAG: carboxylating nicotinate-nucleotide diphosphorylase [Planctomycetota bacterium]